MKKTTLWLAMVGALGLAGCGGGGGDSGGGGTTPPEPQPRALPDAGVYLPILMDAQGQLINRTIDDNYRAAGFVYPTTEGRRWAFRIDEKNASSNTYAFPSGDAPLNQAAQVVLSGPVIRDGVVKSYLNPWLVINSDTLLSQRSISNQPLWVLDYQKAPYRIDGAPAFQNWGGQIALRPMPTDIIATNDWYERGATPQVGDLFDWLRTEKSNNGQGIKLTIKFFGENCYVTGETAGNISGLNKLTLTGWNSGCTFTDNAPNDGKEFERVWKRSMAKFAENNTKVTAYLAMKPATNGHPETLLLGIPEISDPMPFFLEVQPYQP